MNNTIQSIPLANLLIVFLPVLVVLGILFKWSLNAGNALYAMLRMLVQLLLVGYFLAYLFGSDSAWLVVLVLAIMVFASSWIALGSIKPLRRTLYKNALLSVLLGGGSVLIIVTQGVLQLHPWYLPQYLIPLAGMIFASSMNSVSLTAERLNAETERAVPYDTARNTALQAALIPVINSLFAVGIVSLPGMMTGQILSGISPLVAARYQIMVMCMLFSASGIAAVCFLMMVKPVFEKLAQREDKEDQVTDD
jgi:putative ABC transport system permease protein